MIPPRLVYFLHDSDAPQHSGKMQSLLSQFKTEKRIAGFTSVVPEDTETIISRQFQAHDVVVVFLTTSLDGKRNSILDLLSQTKRNFPEASIIQILIDNVPFSKSYPVLPKDQKPIRIEHDMDRAWSGIEANLKQIFPAPASPLSKYIKYAIMVVILLIILLILKPWSTNAPPPPLDDPGQDPRTDSLKH